MNRNATLRGSSLVAAAAVAVGTLVGCSGDDRTTITIAGIIDPGTSDVTEAQYQWIQDSIDEFEEAYPDFRVDYQVYKGQTIDVTMDRDYEAGVTHDVVMAESGRAAGHAEAGSMLDLTDYYESWDPEITSDLDWLSNLDFVGTDDAGQFYMIPATVHARAIAYRTDLLEQAGLDPSSPPQTLDALVEWAQKLTHDDVYGLGMFYGNHPAVAEVYFAPYVWALGGDVFDTETNMATFASPEGVQTARWLSDLVNKYHVTPENVVTGDYVDSVTTAYFGGQYAMVEGFGNYFFADLAQSDYADTTGLFLPPLEQRFLNYWGLGIAASTEHPDESAALLEILMKKEHLAYFDYGLPVHQSAYDEDRFDTPLYQVMKESVATGRTFPQTTEYGNLTDAIAAAVQELVLTDGDPKEILQRYQDEFNAAYGGDQ